MFTLTKIVVMWDKIKALNKKVDDVAANGLPSVTSSDNGKALIVSAGKWSKKNIPSQLPSVTEADAGKALVVNSSGQWVAGSGGGYSVSANLLSATITTTGTGVMSSIEGYDAVWVVCTTTDAGAQLFTGLIPAFAIITGENMKRFEVCESYTNSRRAIIGFDDYTHYNVGTLSGNMIITGIYGINF